MKRLTRVKKVEDINFDELVRRGYRYFLFDFDNTLAPWKERELPEEKRKILEKLSSRARVVIVSNGKPRKVDLPATFIWRAGKPLSFKVWRFLKKEKIDPRRCVMIGDQLFTDILMGKMFGFHVIKVEPISQKEFFGTKILRLFEKMLEGRCDEDR